MNSPSKYSITSLKHYIHYNHIYDRIQLYYDEFVNKEDVKKFDEEYIIKTKSKWLTKKLTDYYYRWNNYRHFTDGSCTERKHYQRNIFLDVWKLYKSLNLDIDSDESKEFFEIIKKYFNGGFYIHQGFNHSKLGQSPLIDTDSDYKVLLRDYLFDEANYNAILRL